MENNMTYPELIATLKSQAATMLDQCDPMATPTVCKMLNVPGNRELLIDSIVRLNKLGYDSDEAIAMLEREYNPNMIND